MAEGNAEVRSGEWQSRAPVVAILEARRPDELAALLRHRGLEPYHAPALREEPQPDPATVDAFITRLASGQLDVVILLTGVGTTAILETAHSLDRLSVLVEALQRVTVLARGPKPAAALRPYGLRPARVAGAPYTTRLWIGDHWSMVQIANCCKPSKSRVLHQSLALSPFIICALSETL